MLEFLTALATVNQSSVSLTGVAAGISAVLDRVCVCVGVSVSPSSSSIDSQPFEGGLETEDDSAVSQAVGIEASATYIGAIIESLLRLISALARGNLPGKGPSLLGLSTGFAG
jgi:hypothetical protein